MTASDLVCTRCGAEGHTVSTCRWPAQLSLPACMGGWCAQRDHCGWHLAADRRHVVERMCVRGAERPQPVQGMEVAA